MATISLLIVLMWIKKDGTLAQPEPADDCFTNPVGISDQAKIPDNHMTASSQYGDGYQPAYGRLYGDRGDGWCARKAKKKYDWLQVDLATIFQVCGVATQGDRNGNEWVTDFKMSYSLNGNGWTPYKDVNGAEVEFHRQGNSHIVDQHKLPVPVSARYFRFHPTKQHNRNCLRVELYSDSPKVVSPDSVVRSLPGYRLSCKATGIPPVYTAIVRNSSVLVKTTTPASITLKYEGNYTCVATNKYGSDVREFSVIFTDCGPQCTSMDLNALVCSGLTSPAVITECAPKSTVEL
ncbi:hypothetical protein ACROYT_G024613 [Oculina patagonica]